MAETITLMTPEQAAAVLAKYPLQDLQEMVYEGHKDFYGYKGRWAMNSNAEELLAWWHRHYVWNDAGNIWNWRHEMMENVEG